jgi:hypothetical protein
MSRTALVRDLVDEVRVLCGPLKLDGHVVMRTSFTILGRKPEIQALPRPLVFIEEFLNQARMIVPGAPTRPLAVPMKLNKTARSGVAMQNSSNGVDAP